MESKKHGVLDSVEESNEGTAKRPKKSKKPRFKLPENVKEKSKFKTPKFKIQNVVATFNLGVDKLDLRELSLQLPFTEYNPHKFAAATLRLRNPRTTALAFASGNLVCTGSKDEMTSRWASRRYVRLLQRYGVPVQFRRFKIQNIVASCNTGHPLMLKELATQYGHYVSYEPDLFPGLVFRTSEPKLVFLCFRSGKVVITGAKTRKEIEETLELLFQNILVNFFDYKDDSKSSSEYRKQIRSEALPLEAFDLDSLL